MNLYRSVLDDAKGVRSVRDRPTTSHATCNISVKSYILTPIYQKTDRNADKKRREDRFLGCRDISRLPVTTVQTQTEIEWQSSAKVLHRNNLQLKLYSEHISYSASYSASYSETFQGFLEAQLHGTMEREEKLSIPFRVPVKRITDYFLGFERLCSDLSLVLSPAHENFLQVKVSKVKVVKFIHTDSASFCHPLRKYRNISSLGY